jgi:hypothetical protein
VLEMIAITIKYGVNSSVQTGIDDLGIIRNMGTP